MFNLFKQIKERISSLENPEIKLSVREAFSFSDRFLGFSIFVSDSTIRTEKPKTFLAYQKKGEDKWNGVVGYEEYKKKTDELERRIDQLLNHLNLKVRYETTEPEKLVPVKTKKKKK